MPVMKDRALLFVEPKEGAADLNRFVAMGASVENSRHGG